MKNKDVLEVDLLAVLQQTCINLVHMHQLTKQLRHFHNIDF